MLPTFSDLIHKLQERIKHMESKSALFVTNTNAHVLWDLYLDSFPTGTNNIYKERREYDCNCCKSFIKRMSNVVAIDDDYTIMTIWDIDVGGYYQPVVDTLSANVKASKVVARFLSDTNLVGHRVSHVDTPTGVKTWNHLHCELENKDNVHLGTDIGSVIGNCNTNASVLQRSLDELKLTAVDTVLELITSDSIYRGKEHKRTVDELRELLLQYGVCENKRNFVWKKSVELKERGRFRNTVIGTLIADLSDGVPLEKAVKSFESKVAPENYKRTSAVVTKGMILKAQEKIVELGAEQSLYRRHAVSSDVSVNNVIYADRNTASTMKDASVFDELIAATSTKTPSHSVEVKIEDFIKDVVPNTRKMELMLENRHTSNLMSIIAPVHADSPNLLKWNNNFTWSYNGEVADSMRQRVADSGGRIDGVLRFTHEWNHNGKNQSLMDLHVFFPTNPDVPKDRSVCEHYGNEERVGWNARKHATTGAVQDVDYTNAPGKHFVPIENITFPNKQTMPEGVYKLKIHNWRFRTGTTEGFKAEVEFDGQVFQYEYPGAVKDHEWIDVAEVTLKDGVFSIKHLLQPTCASKLVWNINTQNFHTVNMVMYSPNHWDGNCVGNKHYMFVLDGCETQDTTRGLYNEFLSDVFTPHRKVFDMLAAKLSVAPTTPQLSGVGFSETVRNDVVIKTTLKDNSTRMYTVKF